MTHKAILESLSQRGRLQAPVLGALGDDAAARGVSSNVDLNRDRGVSSHIPIRSSSLEEAITSSHILGVHVSSPQKDRCIAILFQLSGSEFLVSMVLSGTCERNPNFKFVLGECGIGWIPYIVERIDIEYADRLFKLGLELKPSEYWRRQGYSTFQEEYVSTDEIERKSGLNAQRRPPAQAVSARFPTGSHTSKPRPGVAPLQRERQ